MIRESWLAELSPGAACGPDLEYDEDFLALERAARGKEEQQYGTTVIPAEEPVWADVVERASALLERTHDLRVTHLLARGLTNTQGMAGLAAALGLTRDLLDRFWDPLYPKLVIDDEPDPMVRMNALAGFAGPEGLLRDLRSANLLQTPALTLAMRDVEKILDPTVGAAQEGVGPDQLRAAIGEAIAADPTALGEPQAIQSAVQAIRTTLLSHLEPSALPDFGPLVALVQPVAKVIEDIRAAATAAATENGGEPGTAGAGGPQRVGELRSRDDALRALDRVCDFLARNEPTNPAPLLIRRAQRVMTMPFMEIIRELAPDATQQVENITGAQSQK